MLKCGECTFFKEPEEGTRGICNHPETTMCDHPDPTKKFSEKYTSEYEDDCRYGYPDIWAARGAAKLIRTQKPPKPDIHQQASSSILSGISAGIGVVNGNIQSMTKIV